MHYLCIFSMFLLEILDLLIMINKSFYILFFYEFFHKIHPSLNKRMKYIKYESKKSILNAIILTGNVYFKFQLI